MRQYRRWPAAALIAGAMAQVPIGVVGAAPLCMSDDELRAYSSEVLSTALDELLWSCEGAHGDRLSSHYQQFRAIRSARKAYEAASANAGRARRRALAIRPFERSNPGSGETFFKQSVSRDSKGYAAAGKLTLESCRLQLENWARAIEEHGYEKSLAKFVALSVATSAALDRRPLPKCG